jgi:hypothetical protein
LHSIYYGIEPGRRTVGAAREDPSESTTRALSVFCELSVDIQIETTNCLLIEKIRSTANQLHLGITGAPHPIDARRKRWRQKLQSRASGHPGFERQT